MIRQISIKNSEKNLEEELLFVQNERKKYEEEYQLKLDELNKEKDKINQNKLNGISFDSREIQEGDVFIAFKGKEYNGQNYIDECISKGATLIINETVDKHKNIIKVDSSKVALKVLSKFNVKMSYYCFFELIIRKALTKNVKKS